MEVQGGLASVVRVKVRGPVIPHGVVDGIIDLHAAVDPDTGHFICHYLAVRPEIVEIGGRDYPGLGVGEGLTVVVGEDAASTVEGSGEEVDLARLASGDLDQAPDSSSVSLVFALYRYYQGRIRSYRVGEAHAVVVRPEKGDPVVVLLWPAKKKADGGAILTV